jgi:superfamily II DNA or RNA helicase
MKEIKLYKHNYETYEKVIESWKITNKVAVVQATGTGKSYIILKCLYDFINKKKVVIAPSTYILEQLEREGGELDNTDLLTYSRLSYMTNEEIESLNPSMIILDEFHRCGAESWGNGVDTLIKSFPNAKILGTSATNIRFLDNNRDMAEELFNGNIVTNLSLTEAIIKDILPMPKYVSALYTFNDEINGLKNKVENSKNSENEKEEILKEIEKMKNKLELSKGIPNILKKHLNNNDYKFIVFCKNAEHLNEMINIVVDWFKNAQISKDIKIYKAYTGYINTDNEVEEFRMDNTINTVKILFSIDMFNEGIHIKDITGVILLRPTISPIIYYQQIGRAIQVGKDISPVIFDFVNNFDNIGAKKFINDLKEYSIIEKDENDIEKSTTKNIDIYEFMIFDEIQEAKTLFENIEEKLIDNWDSMYDEISQFYNKNNHSNITSDYSNKLYIWVRNQRVQYNKGILSKERIEKLNKLNFIWNMLEENWNQMYEYLTEYYKKYKHCNVSTKENQKLYSWISGQRLDFKNNKLDDERLEKLKKINFSLGEKDDKWNTMYELLKEYKKEYGDCNVPDKYIYKDEKLGNWVGWQRKVINKDINNKDERIKKLNEIGFVWDIRDYQWDIMYDCLIKYKEQYNTIKISKNCIFNSIKLGTWTITQRKSYKKGDMKKERVQKLDNIGFLW